MKCAIMQPTYLPWSGYFNLIASVDTFIFLDDVQFDRRSWQSRNRICLNGQEHLLSVPTRKAPRDTLIKDIELAEDSTWRISHRTILQQAYAKSPQGDEVCAMLDEIIADDRMERLADLNIRIIKGLCEKLTLSTRLLRASEIGCSGKRSAHLHNLCLAIGADYYLSPEGSREYLAADGFAAMGGVELAFQDYRVQPYRQAGTKDFISHLSIVDMLANIGAAESRRLID
jgi:hypothetical protein